MAREHLFWIGLEKGESVVVFAKGTSPELVVEPEPEDVKTRMLWKRLTPMRGI